MSSSGTSAAVPLAPGLSGVLCTPYGRTDLALDTYHHGLLRSGAPADTIVGIASVVYWGFFTFSHGYASRRVSLIHAALQQVGAAAGLVAAVSSASVAIAAGNYGVALRCFSRVPQLGRLPFGSKAVTFLDPYGAGVYDNRINKFIAASPRLQQRMFPNMTTMPVDRNGQMTNCGVENKAVQARYQLWCLRLRQLRDALNASGALWSCSETHPQCWRAVDVERALFALAALPTAGPRRGSRTRAGNSASTIPAAQDRDGDALELQLDEATSLLEEFFEEQPAA